MRSEEESGRLVVVVIVGEDEENRVRGLNMPEIYFIVCSSQSRLAHVTARLDLMQRRSFESLAISSSCNWNTKSRFS